MGKYGLSDNELDVMLHILSANERISKVILYGSHAKGIDKQFSDIDPAIVGEELTRKDFNALKAALYESPLLYQQDIVIYNSLKNSDLISHIDRCGIVIYSRVNKVGL